MSNPLFNQYGQNPYKGMVEQFNRFAQQMQGNPQEQVQQLLNSGRITQTQYNAAVQRANAIRSFFGV